ncbi:hypothetical protein IAT38_003146 [Cryptococcus sp. DSM 104549]
MAQSTAAARRTTSHGGSSRLSLSVGKTTAPAPSPGTGRHPLRTDWSISYVHRPPNAKVEYESLIRRVATFGSIESFLHLYAHLTPPSELPPITDILIFAATIGRPGMWEEMRDGGRFTIRLVHPITDVLYESLLLSLIGDQFDEADSVVGCVLSMRQTEGILSVWVDQESDGVRNGALKAKILSLLSLPPTTTCEYRANRTLLENAAKPAFSSMASASSIPDATASQGHNHSHSTAGGEHHPRQHYGHHHERPRRENNHDGSGGQHWGGGYRDREGGQRRTGGGAGAVGGIGSAAGLWGQ